jgi:hypothetical protein
MCHAAHLGRGPKPVQSTQGLVPFTRRDVATGFLEMSVMAQSAVGLGTMLTRRLQLPHRPQMLVSCALAALSA